MREIQHILIASDSLDGMDVALEKACLIEHYSGAALHAAVVVYDTIAEEPAKVLPSEQQAQLIEALKAAERNGLRNLIEPFRSRVASIDTEVVWCRDAAEGILRARADAHADLVIKPVSRHGGLADYLHTPLDWALMRESPCAVLVSKQPSWGDPERVLAAVDVSDSAHAALTRAILESAAELARILGTRLDLVCAYPELGQGIGELQVAMDFEGIKGDMRDSRAEALGGWIDALDLEVAELHVLEGKPERVIPKLANELPATLTVLGTAARSGLRKLIIGNTAEDIIDRVNGDIVTIREPWS